MAFHSVYKMVSWRAEMTACPEVATRDLNWASQKALRLGRQRDLQRVASTAHCLVDLKSG